MCVFIYLLCAVRLFQMWKTLSRTIAIDAFVYGELWVVRGQTNESFCSWRECEWVRLINDSAGSRRSMTSPRTMRGVICCCCCLTHRVATTRLTSCCCCINMFKNSHQHYNTNQNKLSCLSWTWRLRPVLIVCRVVRMCFDMQFLFNRADGYITQHRVKFDSKLMTNDAAT